MAQPWPEYPWSHFYFSEEKLQIKGRFIQSLLSTYHFDLRPQTSAAAPVVSGHKIGTFSLTLIHLFHCCFCPLHCPGRYYSTYRAFTIHSKSLKQDNQQTQSLLNTKISLMKKSCPPKLDGLGHYYCFTRCHYPNRIVYYLMSWLLNHLY